jgi:hypothetical protein
LLVLHANFGLHIPMSILSSKTPFVRRKDIDIGVASRPLYATFAFLMASNPQPPTEPEPELLYCPNCAAEVRDPLTCGDCSAVICRRCGTPLEAADELGMG